MKVSDLSPVNLKKNNTRIQSCLLLVALQTSSHNQYTPVIELLFTAIQTEIETETEAEI